MKEQVIGAGMGLISQGINDARQINQQDKLNRQQIKYQKQMTVFNREQQLQMWKDTNAAAQRKEYEKAGLNVGLMYGGSGAGGATANVNTGNVTGGTAPSGGGEIGMGLQTGMQMANLKLIEAQTEKTKAEAENIAGVERSNTAADTNVKTQTIENLKQNVKTEQAKEALTRIQTRTEEVRAEVANQTIEDAISDIKWGVRKTIGEANQAEAKGWVDKATTNTAIETIKAEYSGILLDNMLKQKGLEEIATKIEKLKAEIRQGDTKNAIEKFKAEVQAEYPAVWSTAGKILNDGIKTLEEIGLHTDKANKVKE